MPQRQLSSSDALARDIVRGLYEGRFSAGQRLVEPDVMARYAVSRSTVREAIKKLTAQGIAESHLNRGARIRELTRTDAENILLIIEQLIGLAARQAAVPLEALPLGPAVGDARQRDRALLEPVGAPWVFGDPAPEPPAAAQGGLF